MSIRPTAARRRCYVVVEAGKAWDPVTETFLRRWVIVDDRGDTITTPATFPSASKTCAALMWWVAGLNQEKPASSRLV